MRTTVTLDRDLEQILRDTAARTRKPFKRVLNETLQMALEGRQRTGAQAPFHVQARPIGLRTGFDPAGFNRLADDLEAEAFLEQCQRKTTAPDEEIHTTDLDFGRFPRVRSVNPLTT